MPSSIDFGQINTGNGQSPRLSGTSSQLEVDKLVNSMVEVKKLPATRLEQRITENEAKAAALGDMKSLLGDIGSALAGLRSPPGSLGISENLFETKQAYYSSDTATAPTELMAASVTNSAQTGSFEVIVEQLARARKFASDSVASADGTLADELNGGAAFAGSFSLGLEGGTTAEIDVDGSMDIYDVRSAINAQSAATGVSANVLKVSGTDHRLVLTANETGKEVSLAATGGDDVLGTLGLSADGGASFKNSIQAAQDAVLTVDSVQIRRDSNTIDDALEGVTLDLYGADPGTTVTVDVEPSLNAAKESIVAFVEAYNSFRDFVAQHRTPPEGGEIDEDSPVLFGNRTLRGIEQSVSFELSKSVSGLEAGALSSLGSIGITLDSQNRLQIDEKTLDEALLNNADEVRRIFEFDFQSSSQDLRVMSRTNALSDTDFTVDIVDADNDGQIESATIDGVAVDVDGRRIIGREGTAYEGLVLAWAGTGSTSIDATATQGIADRIYNAVDGAINEIDGAVPAATSALEEQNTRWQADIADINRRAEAYRERLIERFTAMETALSLAESMLTQIRSTTAAMTGEQN